MANTTAGTHPYWFIVCQTDDEYIVPTGYLLFGALRMGDCMINFPHSSNSLIAFDKVIIGFQTILTKYWSSALKMHLFNFRCMSCPFFVKSMLLVENFVQTAILFVQENTFENIMRKLKKRLINYNKDVGVEKLLLRKLSPH